MSFHEDVLLKSEAQVERERLNEIESGKIGVNGETFKKPMQAKDPKSFTQALFDTLPFRLLEWIPKIDQRRDGLDPSERMKRLSRRRSDVNGSSTNRTSNKPLVNGHGTSGEIDDTNRGSDLEPTAFTGPDQVSRRPIKITSGVTGEKQPSKQIGLPMYGQVRPHKYAPGTGSASLHERKAKLKSQGHANGTLGLPGRSTHNQAQARVHVPQRYERSPLLGHVSGSTVPVAGADLDQAKHQDAEGGLKSNEDKLNSSNNAAEIVNGSQHVLPTKYSQVCLSASRLSPELVLEALKCQQLPENSIAVFKDDSHEEIVETLDEYQNPEVYDFIRQSVFYVMKDPVRLLDSFSGTKPISSPNLAADPQESPLRSGVLLHSVRLTSAINAILYLVPSSLLLQSLNYSISAVHDRKQNRGSLSPKSLSATHSLLSNDQIPTRRSNVQREYGVLTTRQAADVCVIGFFVLSSTLFSVPTSRDLAEEGLGWLLLTDARTRGNILPMPVAEHDPEAKSVAQVEYNLANMSDILDDPENQQFVVNLINAINFRLTQVEIHKIRYPNHDREQRPEDFLQMILDHFSDVDNGSGGEKPKHIERLQRSTVEWLRTIFLRDWDGSPVIRRASTNGGILLVLRAMYDRRKELKMKAYQFRIILLEQRLDAMDMPEQWLSFTADNKRMHLLSYSFLFHPSHVVICFRAINHAVMTKWYEDGLIAWRTVARFSSEREMPLPNGPDIVNRLKPATNTYFVMNIRRDKLVEDAMDQVWRRQKRELMRPLRVRLGQDEGKRALTTEACSRSFSGYFLQKPLTRNTACLSLTRRQE